MAKPKHANLFLTVTTTLLLGACAQSTGLFPNSTAMDSQVQGADQGAGQGGEAASAPEKSFNRFPDIPIPSGASMDMTRTIVFGGGEGWYGQLGLDTGHGTNAMFDFYKQELPTFSWIEITSVRAPVSVLTYERQGRICSIQLEQGTLGGTKVTLTISPRASIAGATPGSNAPMMNAPTTMN